MQISDNMSNFIEFLKDCAHALIECGCSSNRVELLLSRLGNSFDYDVEVLALPTGVHLVIRKGHERAFELSRIRSWSVDLNLLSSISDLVDKIEQHEISIIEAHQELRSLTKEPPPYSKLVTLMAGGFASSGLVYLYNGSLLEIGLSFFIGVIVFALQKYVFTNNDQKRYLTEFLSAAIVAVYAWICFIFFPDINISRLIIGGIIALIPGLVFVNAIHELAQKNIVSGTSKVTESLMITLSLASGVAFIMGIKVYLQGFL